jgi:hypothetical protein
VKTTTALRLEWVEDCSVLTCPKTVVALMTFPFFTRSPEW